MAQSKDSQFSVEYQWLQYLKHTGQDLALMKEDQIRETRRAFYGAWGQLLILLKDDLTQFEDEATAVDLMEDMTREVGAFWNSQNGHDN